MKNYFDSSQPNCKRRVLPEYLLPDKSSSLFKSSYTNEKKFVYWQKYFSRIPGFLSVFFYWILKDYAAG